jgi:hypothetical protein
MGSSILTNWRGIVHDVAGRANRSLHEEMNDLVEMWNDRVS